MNKCNLFFLNSPFHVFISEIIKQNLDVDIVNIAIRDEIYNIKNREWDKIINIKNFREYVSIGGCAKFKKDVDKINEVINYYDEINIFLPSLLNTIGNVIYTDLLRNGKKVHLFNFPEGIGNLRLIHSNGIQHIVNLFDVYIKKILVKIYGKKYTDFYGRNDKYGLCFFDVVYSFLPELIKYDVKRTENIKFPKFKNDKYIYKCLVLGQADKRISKKHWILYMKDMASFCKTNFKGYSFFYKPHHGSENYFTLFQEYGFKLYYSEKAIETEILLGERFNVVISPYSTALVTIKIMMGDTVRCISYKGYKYMSKIDRDDALKVKRIFEIAGVELIE